MDADRGAEVGISRPPRYQVLTLPGWDYEELWGWRESHAMVQTRFLIDGTQPPVRTNRESRQQISHGRPFRVYSGHNGKPLMGKATGK